MLARFRIPLQIGERWAVLPAAHGRAVRALLYRWVGRGEPELAQELHKPSGATPKPFACSLLLGAPPPRHGGVLLSREETYWLEVSALTAQAAGALREGLPGPGERVRLARTELVVTAPPMLVREGSYHGLVAQGPLRRWWFRFLSPVVIVPEGSDGPLMLPIPRYLFSNLVRKWNAFAPQEEGLPEFPVAEALARVESIVKVVELASLSTVGLWGPAGGLRGFVGEVGFEAKGGSREDLVGLAALVGLAGWAGIGGRTMEGAGSTEVVSEDG